MTPILKFLILFLSTVAITILILRSWKLIIQCASCGEDIDETNPNNLNEEGHPFCGLCGWIADSSRTFAEQLSRAVEKKDRERREKETFTHLSPKRLGTGVAKKDAWTLRPGKGKTGDKERERAKEIRSAESRHVEDNRDKRRRDMLSSLRCIHDSLIEEDTIQYQGRFEEVVKPIAENVVENLGMMRGIDMDAQELAILATAAEKIDAQKALQLYEVNKEHYERALRKLSMLRYKTGQRKKIRETVSELESELNVEGRTEKATDLAVQSGGRTRTRAAVGIYMAYVSVTQKEAAEVAGCSKKTICEHAKKIKDERS